MKIRVVLIKNPSNFRVVKNLCNLIGSYVNECLCFQYERLYFTIYENFIHDQPNRRLFIINKGQSLSRCPPEVPLVDREPDL